MRTGTPSRLSILRFTVAWTAALLALAVGETMHARATAAEPERISQATARPAPEVVAEVGKRYEHQGPLGTVSRQLYLPYPQPNVSAVISSTYTGASGLRCVEQLSYQVLDDVYQDPELRFSDDNGRTWSDWQRDTFGDITRGKDFWWQWNGNGLTAPTLDPESGLLVSVSMLRGYQDGDPRRIGLKTLHYFSFYSISADNGTTWIQGKQLQYEPGPEYSEAARETKAFLDKNQCWYYYNIVALRSGGIAFPVSHLVRRSDQHGQTTSYDCPRCFLGRWNRARWDYDWTASEPIAMARGLSDYLEEPWLAELADGRLLIDMRGTNAGLPKQPDGTMVPGRHWYALSHDQGRTWSEVRDWRYDTGEPFYSPATMAKILRHSVNGKLYWFGNISRTPPAGNSPRYPLVIAEIDETQPALKKGSLTTIDDYDPARHMPAVQFSNFSVFENRQTHQFELYLSPYGQYANVYQANVNKYVITLR